MSEFPLPELDLHHRLATNMLKYMKVSDAPIDGVPAKKVKTWFIVPGPLTDQMERESFMDYHSKAFMEVFPIMADHVNAPITQQQIDLTADIGMELIEKYLLGEGKFVEELSVNAQGFTAPTLLFITVSMWADQLPGPQIAMFFEVKLASRQPDGGYQAITDKAYLVHASNYGPTRNAED